MPPPPISLSLAMSPGTWSTVSRGEPRPPLVSVGLPLYPCGEDDDEDDQRQDDAEDTEEQGGGAVSLGRQHVAVFVGRVGRR